MKNLLLLLTLAFSLCVYAEKHALIIAIGTYDKDATGWNSINSANDVPIIKEALLARGFKPEHIHVYIDGLDKDGILAAMDKHLVKGVREGDVVYFHFSGHGQQIADDDGDEYLDGLDEALVPFDAPIRPFVTDSRGIVVPYDGKKHLRDDDLGKKLIEIRRKLGPGGNVLVVIDACHSGTSTRGGLETHRGSDKPNVPPGWQPPQSRGKVAVDGRFGISDSGENLAPMACFFGSDAHELNYEYRPEGSEIKYGSLSYAMSRALLEANEKSSYRGLYDHIRNTMAVIANRQTPQAEGELDQQIFGGKLVPKAEYLRVTEWIDEKHVEIDAGKLMALFPGSSVAFYEPDTYDLSGKTPLATGRVISADMTRAEVLLDNVLDKNTALASRCFVREKNFGDMTVSVKVVSANPKYTDQIREVVKDYPFIRLSAEASDVLLECGILEDTPVNKLTVTAKNGAELFKVDLLKDAGGNLMQEILDTAFAKIGYFAQAKYLRGLESPNRLMNAAVSLVPMELNPGMKGDRLSHYTAMPAESLFDSSGAIRVKVCTFYQIQVVNKSPQRLFFSVVDINPNNQVTVLVPPAGKAAEYVIPAGEPPFIYPAIFRLKEPTGNNVLKLIVSSRALDLSTIAAHRGGGDHRGTGSSIEMVFKKSFKYEAGTRSPESVPLKLDEVGIYSLVYTILPPQ